MPAPAHGAGRRPAAGGVRRRWNSTSPFIWAGLIAFAVLAYVVLDGFDLGVGILFPYVHGEADRDQMMNSVAPVWDGNETWLVLGGGGLFAVFPLAYAVIMPALYAPIIAMLLALIFRGVAFEYRWRTVRGKFLWDWAFAGGSTVAAFAQGWRWARWSRAFRSPTAPMPAAGGTGSPPSACSPAWPWSSATRCWAPPGWSTRPRARSSARPTASPGSPPSARWLLIGAVSLWTPFLNPAFMARWLSWPQLLYTAPVPLLVAGAAIVLFRGLARQRRAGAVPGRAGAVRPVLYRARDQLLPVHRAGLGDHLGGRRTRQQPGLPARRRRRPGAR